MSLTWIVTTSNKLLLKLIFCPLQYCLYFVPPKYTCMSGYCLMHHRVFSEFEMIWSSIFFMALCESNSWGKLNILFNGHILDQKFGGLPFLKGKGAAMFVWKKQESLVQEDLLFLRGGMCYLCVGLSCQWVVRLQWLWWPSLPSSLGSVWCTLTRHVQCVFQRGTPLVWLKWFRT